MTEKSAKITKWEHAFKGYASTYNGEILNSFNPELQLKDTESAINVIIAKLSSTWLCINCCNSSTWKNDV